MLWFTAQTIYTEARPYTGLCDFCVHLDCWLVSNKFLDYQANQQLQWDEARKQSVHFLSPPSRKKWEILSPTFYKRVIYK